MAMMAVVVGAEQLHPSCDARCRCLQLLRPYEPVRAPVARPTEHMALASDEHQSKIGNDFTTWLLVLSSWFSVLSMLHTNTRRGTIRSTNRDYPHTTFSAARVESREADEQ
jgi:hypothetical protein